MASTKSPLAPIDDDEVEPSTVAPATSEATVLVSVPPALDADAKRRQANRFKRTQAALKAQPKVKVRVPEDTSVMINGVGYYIQKKVTVEVPQGVYDILVEAGRI